MKAKLLTQCERAKITLSTREKVSIFLPDYFRVEGEEAEIDCWMTRSELESICNHLVKKGLSEIKNLLSTDQADIDEKSISLCLCTGGMINMPMIKDQLREKFGLAKLELSKKGDRIISEGAAWIAHDDLHLALAKPFELLEARNSLFTIIPEGTHLPTRGNSMLPSRQSVYCSDPRDGKMALIFKRPQMVRKAGAADPRTTYGNLIVEINSDFPPLKERIELKVSIDDNLIVHVEAMASDKKQQAKVEFYDLEFSLLINPEINFEKKREQY